MNQHTNDLSSTAIAASSQQQDTSCACGPACNCGSSCQCKTGATCSTECRCAD